MTHYSNTDNPIDFPVLMDSDDNVLHMDYHDAVREMSKGKVIQYIGTENGPVWSVGLKFCMQRGVIFVYDPVRIDYRTCGHMVYDPDFRYVATGETVDPRGWPKHERTVSGYSRIGLGNV